MINSSIMYTAIIVIVIIIITIIINLFILLSDLVVFPGKICHNSRHQPVVLDAVAFFFFLISYPTLSILFSLSQVNKASVMRQSSIPSLISLSISQSAYCA